MISTIRHLWPNMEIFHLFHWKNNTIFSQTQNLKHWWSLRKIDTDTPPPLHVAACPIASTCCQRGLVQTWPMLASVSIWRMGWCSSPSLYFRSSWVQKTPEETFIVRILEERPWLCLRVSHPPAPSGGSCWPFGCWPWRRRGCVSASHPAGGSGTERCE